MAGNIVTDRIQTDTSYASSLAIETNGAERLRIDSSGNLGLGVTPSAWVSASRGLDVGTWAAFSSLNSGAASVLQNSYEYSAGAFKYKNTDLASKYDQVVGQHRWFTAASGTAGNAITFTQAMTLDASGNLGVGVTPSAWGASWKAIESTSGALYFSSTQASIASNAYNDNTNWKYKTTAPVGLFTNLQGVFTWYNAPSGTAGNSITLTQAMTLDVSGNLGVRGSISNGGIVYTGSFYFTGGGTQNILTLAVGEAYMFYSVYTNYSGSDNRHGVYYLAARNASTASGAAIVTLGASGSFAITSAGVVSYTAGGGNPAATIYYQRLS